MARLADYFIVVGYDHEKPGKGVGRAPPPGLPAPAPPTPPAAVQWALRGWASQPGGGEGRAWRRRSWRSVSGLLGGAEPRGGREGPARGEGEGRRGGGGGEEAASAGARGGPAGESLGAATRALEEAGYQGQCPGAGGIGSGLQGWEGGSQLC